MTVTTRAISEKYAREKLRWLADRWDDTGEAVRELTLGALTCPSLPVPCGSKPGCGRCLACLWAEYRDARRTVEALRERSMTWDQFEQDLTCPEPQQQAIEDAAMWAAGVEDVLVRGHRHGQAGGA